jgi:hypothetical protein
MDANAKYVVNMGILIDGLFMELRQYIYKYIIMTLIYCYSLCSYALGMVRTTERLVPIRTSRTLCVVFHVIYIFVLSMVEIFPGAWVRAFDVSLFVY